MAAGAVRVKSAPAPEDLLEAHFDEKAARQFALGKPGARCRVLPIDQLTDRTERGKPAGDLSSAQSL
jgi:hypothetical protein